MDLSNFFSKALSVPSVLGTWGAIAAACFAAGTAVAVADQKNKEHDEVTKNIESALSHHSKTMRESLESLLQEAELSRKVHEDTLQVLQIICVRNSKTDEAREACLVVNRR